VDAKKSKSESQTANYLVKDCQEKGAGWMNWNITNGGTHKKQRGQSSQRNDDDQIIYGL